MLTHLVGKWLLFSKRGKTRVLWEEEHVFPTGFAEFVSLSHGGGDVEWAAGYMGLDLGAMSGTEI